MAVGHPRPSGGLESDVVACLAASEQPMTPAEVRAELGGDLAYTTVMTTLSRLYAKQALTRSLRGRAYAYALVGGLDGAQASIRAHQMQKVLDGDTDRVGVLSRFVEGLDPDDELTLRNLLDAHSPRAASPPPSTGHRRTGRKGQSR